MRNAPARHPLRNVLIASALLWATVPWAAGDDADSFMVRYAVESDFESVADNLRLAITNQGLVINSESHIDEMLDRTGEDLGLGGKIYEHAAAFEFCSATYSRNMMAADPHNIVFCPFVVSVYSTPAEPDTVYIAYRKPQRGTGSEESNAALAQVAELLDTIATEAAQ